MHNEERQGVGSSGKPEDGQKEGQGMDDLVPGDELKWFTEEDGKENEKGTSFDQILVDDRTVTVKKAAGGGVEVISLQSIGSLLIREGLAASSPRFLRFGLQGHSFYFILPMEMHLGILLLGSFVLSAFNGIRVFLSVETEMGLSLASLFMLVLSNVPLSFIVYARYRQRNTAKRFTLLLSALLLIPSQGINIAALFLSTASIILMIALFVAILPVFLLALDSMVEKGIEIIFRATTGEVLSSAWIEDKGEESKERTEALKALHYNALV